MSVRIDPNSGLKIFATRAAKASEKITGKGYATVSDEALKTLPPAPAGAVFDAVEQAKYRCLLYTSPSPRDRQKSRMPSSA